MYYGYDMCPRCKNKLIKRVQMNESKMNFEKYGDNCEKCGNTLRLSCIGEKEVDDTLYKIKFRFTIIEDLEKCIKGIIKVSSCSRNLAVNKLKKENSVLFEGDLFHTFQNMKLLDESGVIYSVAPEFPFERIEYFDCPDCGCETIEKIEDLKDKKEFIKVGWYCKNCNQWVGYNYISKISMDETIYKLIFTLGVSDCELKTDINNLVDKLQNKTILKDKIAVSDIANNLHPILQKLKALNIGYEINPQYPHIVTADSELDEDYLNEILKQSIETSF